MNNLQKIAINVCNEKIAIKLYNEKIPFNFFTFSLYKEIKKTLERHYCESKITGMIHDSFTFNIIPEEFKTVKYIIKEIMRRYL
jgi:hypothetical protein